MTGTTKLTYLAAILAITLDLFVWRPDLETQPEQLRPTHARGYGELKALAIARSDAAFRQRQSGASLAQAPSCVSTSRTRLQQSFTKTHPTSVSSLYSKL